MAITYEPIATTTLGTAANTITLSSIPSTYTDLRLIVVCTTAASDQFRVLFNADATAVYSFTTLGGQGAVTSSGNGTNVNSINMGALSNTNTTIPEMFDIQLFSYVGSTFKTMLGRISADQNGSGATDSVVGLWRSTSAVTSIRVFTNNGNNFSIGTTATLYGIKAA